MDPHRNPFAPGADSRLPRAKIIAKGMIYSTDHGYLDFTVPLFAQYMRRQGVPLP